MRLRSKPRAGRKGAGKPLSRVAPALVTAAMAGAVSGAFGSDDALASCFRTGGAVVEAWAFGTLTTATQPPPKSTTACDLSHACQLVVDSAGGAGTGTGLQVNELFNPPQGPLPSNLPFELVETIDYPHGVRNGVGGSCYPVNGTITATVDASSTLVLDFQGQACEMATAQGEVIVDGHYIGDPASTGEVANPDAVGSIDIESPSGLESTATALKASLTGQLLFSTPTTVTAHTPITGTCVQ